MLPYFHFQTISLGPINIQIWGLLFALSIIIATIYIVKEGANLTIKSDTIYDFIFWTLIGIIIGGRIGFVVAHPGNFSNFVDYFTFWDGGLAYYGGFFGGLITGSIYLKKQKINYLKFVDLAVPAIALGLAIGRIGCYLTGEHLGGPTGFFLGVNKDGMRIHQTSVYLIISNLVLFGILRFFSKEKRYDGQIALLFLILYSLFRFIIDGFRADEPNWAGLTPSQWISIPIFIVSSAVYIKQLRDVEKKKILGLQDERV